MLKTGLTLFLVFSAALFPFYANLHISDNAGFSMRPARLMSADSDCQ